MSLTAGAGKVEEPLTGRSVSSAELRALVAARAGGLSRCGVGPGKRVFLHFGNSIEFFACLLAVWRLGASAVPVDPRLTAYELGVLAAAARPHVSLFVDGDAGVGRELATHDVSAVAVDELPAGATTAEARVQPGDEALILFTSGTTGNPKGVVHTHGTLRARWAALDASLGRDASARTLCLLPTHFGHGLICNSLFPLLHGGDLFILPPFRADSVSQLGVVLDEHEITFMSSVPPVWTLGLRLSKPPEKGSLRRVFCGSAPFSLALWEQIGAWSGGAEVVNAYGITETGSWTAGSLAPGAVPEDGLVGVGWGAEIAVLEGGETEPPGVGAACKPGEAGDVWLRTPALMQGYLDRPDLTAQVVRNGWFTTGDVGLLDERGFLYLRGRKREEINKGGMKVYPGDVDLVAGQAAGVVDACAFAIPDPLYGEDVGLAVVLDGDGDLAALRDGLAVRLASHQLPKRIYALDEIPRTSRGKINRSDVAGFCAGREADA